MVDSFSTWGLLIRREWSRMLMEPSRVFGVLLQPLVFLAVFGLGFHQSFNFGQTSYSSFFYPGILGLVVLFSSIYATLTLVEDKKCGFFRLVLVGPAGVRGAILGKVLATTSLGFCQSLLFLPLSFFLPIKHDFITLTSCTLLLLLGSWCFAMLGVLFAWICPSSSAFHALMSVILIPMWLLSGAMFPLPEGMLSILSFLNPMAYLVNALRSTLLDSLADPFDVLMLALFSLLFLGLLLKASNKPPE